MSTDIHKYKGKVAFLFLCVRPIKNPQVWNNFFSGYQDYFNIYAHISGNDYDKAEDYWPDVLWNNRVEKHGIQHTPTAWGTVSLVIAEGLLYKTALKNRQNKYFCILSESDIPLWSFPQFYNMLNTKNKSYMTLFSAKGDEDIFKKCFPEKFIPSSNHATVINQRDRRKITLRTTHQWKVLVRREAKEFVKMCNSKKYIKSYDQCFTFDPERLAPDEYAFSNWLVLKYGLDYLKKNIINIETTFVDFDKKAIHAMEFPGISKGMKFNICNDKPFFARKFPVGADTRLVKEIPIRCRSKSKSKKKRRSKKL